MASANGVVRTSRKEIEVAARLFLKRPLRGETGRERREERRQRHLKVAAAYTSAGMSDRASHHWKRAGEKRVFPHEPFLGGEEVIELLRKLQRSD